MDYDVIVVGGGIAGLTATAYLAKAGYSVLLCEKESACGGLVHSFTRGGFTFDGGMRAMENSGIVFPMLKQLGLDVPFVKNRVSIGIEDRVIHVDSVDSVSAYHTMLNDFYPESADEIAAIITQIRKIMRYMDIQYGINNPIFLDVKQDRDYFMRVVFPWMIKYVLTIAKVNRLKEPVVDYLRRFTGNQSLLDIITQHFFRETPAYFALSYVSLYLDYWYPLGGTGTLSSSLIAYIMAHQGVIRTDTEIVSVDPDQRTIIDRSGHTDTYKKLIWAANLKSLYNAVSPQAIRDGQAREAFTERKAELMDKPGGDSVLTLYLALDLDKQYFADLATEHFFYTPSRTGQTQAGPFPLGGSRAEIEAWLKTFLALTTYEIAIPVLRDETLAPPGKTGLIVSLLFDYQLTRQIKEMGWYPEFKAFIEKTMVDVLEGSIYPGIRSAIREQFSSTPLTLARIAGNADGAITGWAFGSRPVPAESRLPKVMRAVRTPIPDVYQAGQWTFSPSGLPVSILTGKLAVDQAVKALGKRG